jgi:hypothetical protein
MNPHLVACLPQARCQMQGVTSFYCRYWSPSGRKYYPHFTKLERSWGLDTSKVLYRGNRRHLMSHSRDIPGSSSWEKSWFVPKNGGLNRQILCTNRTLVLGQPDWYLGLYLEAGPLAGISGLPLPLGKKYLRSADGSGVGVQPTHRQV